MATNTALTNTFGTEGDFAKVLAALNTNAFQAFDRWLVENTEVQNAAAALREDVFAVWLDNNAGRLVRAFEKATR